MGVSWYHKPSTETEEIPNPNLCTLCSTWAFGGLGCGQPWTFPSPWLDQYHSQWTSLQSSLSCRYFFNSLFFISLLRPFKFGRTFLCSSGKVWGQKPFRKRKSERPNRRRQGFIFCPGLHVRAILTVTKVTCVQTNHHTGTLQSGEPPVGALGKVLGSMHLSSNGSAAWGAWATTWTPTRCWGLPTKLRHVRSSSLRFFAGNAYTIHFMFVLFFGCLYFEQWWKGPLVV